MDTRTIFSGIEFGRGFNKARLSFGTWLTKCNQLYSYHIHRSLLVSGGYNWRRAFMAGYTVSEAVHDALGDRTEYETNDVEAV